ncbi:DUF4279 domain-containing protein [Chitinophaga costaii]|nr:DUF4279 domain-containing protein [Chitinophaga costaii]
MGRGYPFGARNIWRILGGSGSYTLIIKLNNLMRNEVILSFVIADFDDISPDKITENIGITPVRIYIKGERKNPNLSGIAKRNRWIMGSGLDKYASFEDQMNAMLDIIESKIELLRPFCEKYYCEFSCAIFIRYDNDESTPSVHLDARYNRLTKELNIEFDVDLYCLPNKDE